MSGIKLHYISGLIAILFICLIIPAVSLARPINPPAPPSNQIFTPVEKTVLDNGLTILLKQKSNADIVSIVALVKTGSATENKFLGSGISHLTEHMLFKDNPENPKSEIAKQIRFLGGDIDGSTSYDWTIYIITLPKENTLKALELLKVFLFKPEFKAEDLEREKQVVLKEINLGKDNPGKCLWDLLMETSLTKHPYRYPVIGYESLLARINLLELEEYYTHTYTPGNIILSLAGDFNKEKILSKIDELFAKIPSGPIWPNCSISEPTQIATRKVSRQLKTTSLAYAAISFPSVSLASQDMYALDVLSSILGGRESSRLNQKLKENLKIVYSISAIDYTPQEPGLFIITFSAQPENLKQSFDVIFAEIENLKVSGITNPELQKAKQAVKSAFLFSRESCDDLAGSAAQFEAAVNNPDFDQQYLEKIDRLKVADIQAIAIKYLNPLTSNVVSVEPAIQEKQSNVNTVPTTPEPEIKIFQLPGNLRVLLREDKSLPLVTIRIAFLGGLLAQDASNNGIANLTSSVLLKGTNSKTALEISNLVESWGAQLDSFSGNNSGGIYLKILKENLPQGLELLSQIITSPAFSLEEIEKEKVLTLAMLKQQKEDIFTIGSLLLKKELYPNYPYSFNPLGDADIVKNISREQISDFYKKQIIKPNMVISIFGDIEAQGTLELVNKFFSKINSTGPSPIINIKPKPLSRNITQFEILEKEQSLYMLGFSTVSLNNPDKYALAIISEALSGLNGRLFKNIRKDLGIAYALGAQNSELLEGGHIIIYVATTKENLKKAQSLVWQEIKKLKNQSITSEELDRIKRGLIGKMKISLETNDGLAGLATFDELYGLGFNNYQRFEKAINSVSIQEIKRVSNRYLSDLFVEIFITPSTFLSEAANKPKAQTSNFSFKNILSQFFGHPAQQSN